MTRRVFVLCAMAVLACAPPAMGQSAPTEDSLRLAHQTLLSGIATGNPAMVEPLLHRSGLGFFRDSEMIAQLGGDYGPRAAVPAVLADLGRFTMSAYDSVFRVAGMTGVVCMATRLQPKKGEKGSPHYLRSTWVYVNLDGAWRLFSWHTSDIPLKK